MSKKVKKSRDGDVPTGSETQVSTTGQLWNRDASYNSVLNPAGRWFPWKLLGRIHGDALHMYKGHPRYWPLCRLLNLEPAKNTSIEDLIHEDHKIRTTHGVPLNSRRTAPENEHLRAYSSTRNNRERSWPGVGLFSGCLSQYVTSKCGTDQTGILIMNPRGQGWKTPQRSNLWKHF